MPSRSLLFAISLIVSVGWTTALAHADDREPPLAAPARLAMSQATMPPADGAVVPPVVEAERYPAHRRPICDWMRNHKPGCWSHHNELSCGSCKSECTFIFGSCRAFFGEPCLSGPIPPVFPGDYGYPGCRRCP